MISNHFRAELGRMVGVLQDARHLSATRWRQHLDERAAAPLLTRLAFHQANVRDEVRHAFPGLDLLHDEHLSTVIFLGVVDAGEDAEAVEAALGFELS